MLGCLPLQSRADDYEQRRKYDAYFLEAMLERQKGHNDAAFSLLTRCQEIDSTASEAYFFLAQYYTEMKENDKALDYFKKAYQRDSVNTTYMETLAHAYISNERWTDAISVVERLYEIDKSRQDLLETLYQLHMKRRDFERAIAVLDRMELIDGKSEKLSLAKSGLYLQMDNFEAGLAEVKALSERYPNDLNYRTLYANTLLMSKTAETEAERRKEAWQVLRDVLAEEPDNYRAQTSMRAFYLNERDTLKADSLTRSLLLNPATSIEEKVGLLRQEIGDSERQGGDSTRVLQLFHLLLSQPDAQGDIAEFCAHYMDRKSMPRDSIADMLTLALHLSPDNASARLLLVQYAWEDTNHQRVVELCQQARQYNPDEMVFYYYQGMAYYQLEDRDHALEAFRNGISVITEESNPAIVSDFYAVMGDLLHQKGMLREAYEAYDSCLAWQPDNIGCLNNYAYFLSLQGTQLEKAEEMSRKTILTAPRNSTYLDTYAWILFAQRHYDDARKYIEQALANDSVPSSEILEHAGDIYAMNGDIDTALDYWRQAQQKSPNNKLLNRKIKKKKYIKK